MSPVRKYLDGAVVVGAALERCAQGGYDLLPTAGADLGVDFSIGDVADPIRPISDSLALTQPAAIWAGAT